MYLFRRGTIRVLGLLGALDPYKHKMNVGAIKIQEDTGVAVISITETKTDDLSPGMFLFLSLSLVFEVMLHSFLL